MITIVIPIELKKRILDKVEKDYSRLHLPPISRQYVEEFTRLWLKFLPMSEMAIRGFISLTMRDFQLQTHIEAPAVLQLSEEERKKNYEKMLSILVEKISKALVKPEQKSQLETAIREVWKRVSQI